MSMGQRLKQIRVEANLNQLELAALLHVSGAHVSKLEADKANPSDMFINSVCLIFHVDEHWFRTGEGTKQSRVDRIYDAISDKPELRQRLSAMVLHESQRKQLGYLFAPASQRLDDMLTILFSDASDDFLARLNLLIKEWIDCKDDIKKKARIEVRMEEAVEDFPEKLADYRRFIKNRSGDGTVVPFTAVTATEVEGEPTRVTLPVLGRAAAGEPKGMIELSGEELLARNDQDHIIQPGDFIVIADGDSMIDCGIHDGDYCVIHQTPEVENGQIALIAVGDGSTIKRFYKVETGFRLVACNAAYPDQHYPPDADVRVLGHFIKAIQPEA